jgi:lipopolysaccharide transport system ATP-binding protein
MYFDPNKEEIAISVRDLSKVYRIFSHPGDRLKQAVSFGFRRYYKRFTAVQDVSFDIRQGETVGIIGRNGTGKSTLLQLICGILKPSNGTVKVRGRISALLELGAGFNAEFTGRENVYFYCALFGLKKEDVDARFDDIASFADIGQYLDQPVRTYSSGMFVRLAFATVVHVDSDILVVDEALAVGDEAFQRKCFDRLEDMLARQQMVLLFVSHNVRQVERICSRAILLENGRVLQDGQSSDVCSVYHNQWLKDTHTRHLSAGNFENVTKSGELEVFELALLCNEERDDTAEIQMHARVRVAIRFRCHTFLESPEIVIGFHTADAISVASCSSASLPERRDFDVGEHLVECLVPDMMLAPGMYYIRLMFFDCDHRSLWDGHKLHPFTVTLGQTEPSTRSSRMRGLIDMPFEWTAAACKTER